MDLECQIPAIPMVPLLSVGLGFYHLPFKSLTANLRGFNAHNQSVGPYHILVVFQSDMNVMNSNSFHNISWHCRQPDFIVTGMARNK
jgi:hypothetical protein